jgi:glycosyltransferase involved in cell wall biosynthesis
MYRPDFFLAQARRWSHLFAAAGSKTFDLPNPVDCARLKPVSDTRKQALRKAHGLPNSRPIALHVGHLRPSRNLECLLEVQRSGHYQVAIVASPNSRSQGKALCSRLQSAGCIVRTDFLPSVEEVYQAADVYVFTANAPAPGTFPGGPDEAGSIDFPLSILEAMASGLPVVTTRLDAVEYFIRDVPGLRYFDGTGSDCLQQLHALCGQPVATRKAAERFAETTVQDQLNSFYARVEETIAAT